MLRKYMDGSTNETTLKDIVADRDKRILIHKIINITLVVICLLQMAMILVISNYPKSQGYVIEVAADGSTTMNSDAISLLENWTPASETIQHFLGEFINELRSVSSDPQIVQTNIDKLYNRVTGLAIQEVTDYIKETNPKNRLKTETVTVKIASILPLSDTTYQIDFRETVFSSGKRIKSDTHYRCVAHTQIYTPKTKKQALYNPIGLYISDFTITEVKEI